MNKISNIRYNLEQLYLRKNEKFEAIDLLKREQKLSFYQKSISSFIASTFTNFAVTPLDVVKIRLQAQEKALAHQVYQPRLTSTWHTFRTIFRNEGVSSLWSGIFPTLLISIPVTILYFPLYDKVKYALGYDEQNESTSFIPPLAGILCRTTIVVFFNPLELYRTKLQSTPLTLTQLVKASKTSYNLQGPSFLFYGTSAALLRDVPFSAIYWYLYEKIKSKRLKDRGSLHAIDNLIAGAAAGSVAAGLTVPFDVIKTHWQIELGSKNVTSSTSIDMIKTLWSRNGPKSLFAGFAPRLIRVTPACAIMITSYEALKNFFIRYNAIAEQ